MVLPTQFIFFLKQKEERPAVTYHQIPVWHETLGVLLLPSATFLGSDQITEEFPQISYHPFLSPLKVGQKTGAGQRDTAHTDKPGNQYVKWKEPDTEDHILFIPFIWNFCKEEMLWIWKADQRFPRGCWEQGLSIKEQEENFQGDGVVLKLYYGDGCIAVYV